MDRFPNTRQPDRDWWESLWPNPTGVLRRLGIDAGDSLADVGCGDGYFTLSAAELLTPAPVYAIDVDQDLVEAVVTAADERALSNVHGIVGDARRLESLLPEPVDVVLVANLLHGVEDPTSLAAQARRSLRSDGRLVVLNWRDRPRTETVVDGEPRGPPRHRRLTPTETRSRVDDSFDTFEVIDLPPHHYALVCR